MLAQVIHLTNRDRLVRVDQLAALVGDQERLHELARHRDVEELARLRLVPQLDDSSLLVERDVGERADADVERRVLPRLHRLDGALRELGDIGFGVLLILVCIGIVVCRIVLV